METKGVRYLTAEILRFLAEESKMAFVAGPRQVGKTTMAKHLLKNLKAEDLYFNWDIESHRKAIIRNPEDFWLRTSEHVSPDRWPIVLDEIHKFPRWKRFLKGLYDGQKNKVEVIVTGSGRLDIYQKGGDSLAGRYHRYHLHPFTLGEMVTESRDTVTEPEKFWKLLGSHNVPESAAGFLRDLETLTGFPEPL
ncbi:MAG: AAA family ATPase, partial [Ignavibacteriales bacterium]|nr:AAA family ATPase [Ignavibacteriales bacterium]